MGVSRTCQCGLNPRALDEDRSQRRRLEFAGDVGTRSHGVSHSDANEWVTAGNIYGGSGGTPC